MIQKHRLTVLMVCFFLNLSPLQAWAQEVESPFEHALEVHRLSPDVAGYIHGEVTSATVYLVGSEPINQAMFTAYTVQSASSGTIEFGILGGVVPDGLVPGWPVGAFNQYGEINHPQIGDKIVALVASVDKHEGTKRELPWGSTGKCYVGGYLPILRVNQSTAEVEYVPIDLAHTAPSKATSFWVPTSGQPEPQQLTLDVVIDDLKRIGFQEVTP